MCEEPVADKDASRDIPTDMHRRLMTSESAGIQNIVMHQSGCMNQFNDNGKPGSFVGAWAKKLCGQER